MPLFFLSLTLIMGGGILPLFLWRRFIMMKTVGVLTIGAGCLLGLSDAATKLTIDGSYSTAFRYLEPFSLSFRIDALSAFFLVAIFIWFAENLGTFARAWSYPGQEAGWEMVSLSKLGSWYLLMIISFVLVATVHRGRGEAARENHQTPRREPG